MGDDKAAYIGYKRSKCVNVELTIFTIISGR